MKSKVHPTYKTKYRVANWPAYNQALVRRGDVTVWLSSEAIAAWTPRRSGRRGGQRRYSDLAIETALTLRPVRLEFPIFSLHPGLRQRCVALPVDQGEALAAALATVLVVPAAGQ